MSIYDSRFGYRPFITSKLTCRYIFYVELYSGVVLFSLIFRVKVRVRVRFRQGVSRASTSVSWLNSTVLGFRD